MAIVENFFFEFIIVETALGRAVQIPIKLTQVRENSVFSFVTFWWGVVFILFALQFWAVVISNHTLLYGAGRKESSGIGLAIQWIVIYPVDNDIHPLNNLGQNSKLF